MQSLLCYKESKSPNSSIDFIVIILKFCSRISLQNVILNKILPFPDLNRTTYLY